MNSVEFILHNFEYSLDFLRAIVSDLSDAQMVEQSALIKNHPAWVLGHLSFSCQAIGGEIGLDCWLAEDWGSRFGMGSEPDSDPRAYESKKELLSILSDAQLRVSAAVHDMSIDELNGPLPDANYREDLPTKLHALNQILVAHTAYHVGQTVIWRRSVGLPKVDRPFL